ncbi:TonB-dependent siderophore receptor [Thalassospira mesophila]|uniref:Ferrichrome receptor n=1 Tax=Thalassospira mesophila TaxID=1293891 RepID=A0A1Y2KX02_9PROT|nr:TonB-dependent siderophore receptor [Thalassospira mesophila]OSQ36766.1 ferrichrome receptor [Thalassospira mesophila]
MNFKTHPWSKSFLLGTAALLSISYTSFAHAQSNDAEVVVDPIVIDGEQDKSTAISPVNGYVAQKTSAGSKTDTPISEVPQSVSVIGREEMDDRGATKIDEALRYTPGVYTQPFGPDSDTNWIFIRGFQATATGVYMDGLQNYSYGFGGFYVDSYNLERVEVLRGASSVLYGGANPGGLVNYVSKRPTGDRLRHVDASVTDTGKMSTGIDFSDRLSNVAAYRLSGIISDGDGSTDFSEGFKGSIAPSFTWTPNDTTSLTILTNYTFMDETHNGGAFLPYTGTVVDAPFGKIDPDSNFTEPGLDKYLRRQYSAGYELSHDINDNLTFRQNLRVGRAEIHEVSLYAYGYDSYSATPTGSNYDLSRINFEHRTTVNTIGLDNQLEQKFDTGFLNHTLMGGIDYKRYDMDQVQLSGSATTINAVNPVYDASAQGARSSYIDQDLVMNQVGFYAQDQIRFGDGWLTTLNGRYDYLSTKSEGTTEYDSTEGEWSGRAGLAYLFDNGLTPYASVSSSFNPVLDTTNDGALMQPETGQQYEVGLKYAPTSFDALFTVAMFDLTRQNVVTGSGVNKSQLGEVNSKGLEFEAKTNLTRNLKLTASFTAMAGEITKDNDATTVGKTPYLFPERQAALAVDYTFDQGVLDGITLGGGARYQGATWADNANKYKVPSATVYDAKIGYAIDNMWGVDLNVTNLFDKTYVAGCQTEFSCGYAEGRTALLKLHVNW